jgi:hypothetical protein
MVSVEERRMARDIVWEKFDCAAGAFSSSFGDIEFVAAEMVGSWSEIPTALPMC